jgi:VanZ family protein
VRGASHSAPPDLHFRRFWQGIGWMMVAVVVWLSLAPHPPAPPSFLGWDKAQHFLAYGCLMFWFRQAFAHHWRWPALLVILGVGLEWLQGFTDLRSSDPFDIFANSIGVAIGLLVAATPAGRLVAIADAQFHAMKTGA